jgi:hypothetical protein
MTCVLSADAEPAIETQRADAALGGSGKRNVIGNRLRSSRYPDDSNGGRTSLPILLARSLPFPGGRGDCGGGCLPRVLSQRLCPAHGMITRATPLEPACHAVAGIQETVGQKACRQSTEDTGHGATPCRSRSKARLTRSTSTLGSPRAKSSARPGWLWQSSTPIAPAFETRKKATDATSRTTACPALHLLQPLTVLEKGRRKLAVKSGGTFIKIS